MVIERSQILKGHRQRVRDGKFTAKNGGYLEYFELEKKKKYKPFTPFMLVGQRWWRLELAFIYFKKTPNFLETSSMTLQFYLYHIYIYKKGVTFS